MRSRLRLTTNGHVNSNGRAEKRTGSKLMLSLDRIIGAADGPDGVQVRTNDDEADLLVTQSIDQIVAAMDGELIKLTPVGFAGFETVDDRFDRGWAIAVNPDHLAILPIKDKRGTVIAIEQMPRDLVVAEKLKEIEAMIA